ncbi:hypothetical protein [Sediminibacillus massiliensis]|uniref:hypothetical protein n=1 Tax=Sediminibacillus massiliensis TaxID=1926277 RepID=UPI0009885013|nr:hypothetical protein [Sediminibacillus massiliensis]
MKRGFEVKQDKEKLTIIPTHDMEEHFYNVFLDEHLVAIHMIGRYFFIDISWLKEGSHHLVIVASRKDTGTPAFAEQYLFHVMGLHRDRDFQPGDILVASDNLDMTKTGYVGHSALVVEGGKVIESPGLSPAIRKDTIDQFLRKHPEHAQFRPKSAQMGHNAVVYAEAYLSEFKEKGEEAPVFSFSLSSSLDDPWEYIYCSKLIWLSYYHGAGYEMKNDFLWFSPEDLYKNLSSNGDFELIYEHPNVKFILNT